MTTLGSALAVARSRGCALVACLSHRQAQGDAPEEWDASLRRCLFHPAAPEGIARLTAVRADITRHVLDQPDDRYAALLEQFGSALGIDPLAPAIARARELAAAQGPGNVRFESGDAQTYPFPARGFDVVISRFGTMFFASPITAFRNIRGALTDSGRLVMMVWQAREANEWSTAIHGAQAQSTAAFSLADPATAERILDAAGFAHASFQDVHEPVYYGDSIEAALGWIGQFQVTKSILQSLDPEAAERERARLREIVAGHYRDGGVWFDSRAWIISARCR